MVVVVGREVVVVEVGRGAMADVGNGACNNFILFSNGIIFEICLFDGSSRPFPRNSSFLPLRICHQ